MKTSYRWKLTKTAMGNFLLYKKVWYGWKYEGYYSSLEDINKIISNLEYERFI